MFVFLFIDACRVRLTRDMRSSIQMRLEAVRDRGRTQSLLCSVVVPQVGFLQFETVRSVVEAYRLCVGHGKRQRKRQLPGDRR